MQYDAEHGAPGRPPPTQISNRLHENKIADSNGDADEMDDPPPTQISNRLHENKIADSNGDADEMDDREHDRNNVLDHEKHDDGARADC